MVADPGATPLTMPVLLTAAIEVLLLLHVPPVLPSVNVITESTATALEPVIVPAAGNGFTVNAVDTALAAQEPAYAVNVYTPAFPATTAFTDATKSVGPEIAVPPGPVHK